MPIDKQHPPSFYPQRFREAMSFRGEGYGFEIARGDEATALREARRFRAFVSSCQQYPLSSEYKTLLAFVARTKVKELASGQWLCLVVVKRKLFLEERLAEVISGAG